MVCGMKELNLLLFKKMASNSLVNRAGGISPSKLLNLRSRYLTTDHSRTTSGKRPTKRLVLISNSNMRVSL